MTNWAYIPKTDDLNMGSSTFLFVEPSTLRGFARISDLTASLSKVSYNKSRTPSLADRRAFLADWAALREDWEEARDEIIGDGDTE